MTPTTANSPCASGRWLAGLLLLAAMPMAVGCYASIRYTSPAPTPRHSTTTTTTTTTHHGSGRTTSVTTTTEGWVYYPDVYVYYNPHAGVYYYYDHGRWVHAYSLPRSLTVHMGRGVRISYVGHRPYTNYHIHVSNYRPRSSVRMESRFVPPRSYRHTPAPSPTTERGRSAPPSTRPGWRPAPGPSPTTERGSSAPPSTRPGWRPAPGPQGSSGASSERSQHRPAHGGTAADER